MSRPAPLVLLAGNPNSGKSTLFNALTGSRAHVANYPGVTVDRTSARFTTRDGREFELIDLPGTYSLSARSREEQIAVDAVLGRGLQAPQAVVVVVDAVALGRALYLVIEILATGVPVVIALNMSDEAARDGIAIDITRLEALTGAEVVRTVATRGEGIADLLGRHRPRRGEAAGRRAGPRPPRGPEPRSRRARSRDPSGRPARAPRRRPRMGHVAAAFAG